MDLLTTLSGCSLLSVSAACPQSAPSWPLAPVPRPGVVQWQPIIAEAAQTFALPQSWVSAVMAQESGGRTHLNGKPITSRAGAMGLMQVMPRTFADMRRLHGLGGDPHEPRDNIHAGTAYLRDMYERYGYPHMFAAYNAGPGRLDDFLQRQRPLPKETLDYVASIVPGAEIALGVPMQPRIKTPDSRPIKPSVPPESGLFFAQDDAKGLFVIRHTPRS